jgi:hypothetical protein
MDESAKTLPKSSPDKEDNQAAFTPNAKSENANNSSKSDKDSQDEKDDGNVVFPDFDELVIESARDVPWFLIEPDSKCKHLWSLIILSLVIYVATILPIRIAFLTDSQTWLVTDYVIDFIFMVDVALNFFII